jgi:hypothetical protein
MEKKKIPCILLICSREEVENKDRSPIHVRFFHFAHKFARVSKRNQKFSGTTFFHSSLPIRGTFFFDRKKREQKRQKRGKKLRRRSPLLYVPRNILYFGRLSPCQWSRMYTLTCRKCSERKIKQKQIRNFSTKSFRSKKASHFSARTEVTVFFSVC